MLNNVNIKLKIKIMKIQKQKDRYAGYAKDYKLPGEFMEKNSGEILTLKNEAFSIRELLEKFTTNQFPNEVVKNGQEVDIDQIDIDDTDIDALHRVDVTFMEEHAAKVKSAVIASKKSTKSANEEEPKEKRSESAGDDEEAIQ